jgi:hypothetical protein
VAELASEAFRGRFLSGDAADGPHLLEGVGWFGVRVAGRRLAAVLGGASEGLAGALLAEAMGKTPGGRHESAK